MEGFQVKIGLFGRLLGSHIQQVHTDSSGIWLHGKRGDKTHLSWSQLKAVPSYRSHLISGSFHLETDEGRIAVRWLNKDDVFALRTRALVGFYQFHESAAKVALKRIHEQLQRVHYLRSSHCKPITEYAEKILSRVQIPPTDLETELPDTIINSFKLLAVWAYGAPQFIEDIRNQYVSEQKERFQYLFDTIESNPLTDNTA